MATRVLTVPNQLTFLRLGFLPFFIMLVFYRRFSWALAILVVAAMTDGLDGLLARSLDQKTALGAVVYPIALLQVARQILIYLVAGFTVFSGFHYSVIVARRLSPDHQHSE